VSSESDAGTARHRAYWDGFYASRDSAAVPGEPSMFARWVLPMLAPGQPLVEVGFGTGRDSFWFLDQGREVLGFDFATSAVERARGHADGQGSSGTFEVLDLYDAAAVCQAARIVAARTRPALYGRFLIHALEAAGRHHLFDLAAAAGGDIYLEFRTGQDRGERHAFGDDHFRIFLEPELVADELRARGAVVTRSEADYGLAVYQDEDPHVARIVASW
jgi:hypothetical protein